VPEIHLDALERQLAHLHPAHVQHIAHHFGHADRGASRVIDTLHQLGLEGIRRIQLDQV